MAALKESLGLVYNMYVRTRLQLAAAGQGFSASLIAPNGSGRTRVGFALAAKAASSAQAGHGQRQVCLALCISVVCFYILARNDAEDVIVDEEVSDQLVDAAIIGRAHLKTAVPLLGSRLRDALAALNALDVGGTAVPRYPFIPSFSFFSSLLRSQLVPGCGGAALAVADGRASSRGSVRVGVEFINPSHREYGYSFVACFECNTVGVGA